MTTTAKKPEGIPVHPKPNKVLNVMKGPEVLTPAQIKDIVESRPNHNSRKLMADKYGISVLRVTNIWKQYYGGATLKDYGTGIKRALPNGDVRTADLTLRKFRSERGTYLAKEPKIVDNTTAKAAPIRKLAPKKILGSLPEDGEGVDLDLHNTAQMGDNEAQILAGEMRAGNDNEELLTAVYDLLEHNQNISDRAISALESALKTAIKKGNKNSRARYSEEESNYSDSNIETDNDDSTATYKNASSTNKSRRGVEGHRDDNDEHRETYRESPTRVRSTVGVPENSGTRLVGDPQLGQDIRKTSPGSRTRAQPVYRTVHNGNTRGQEQGNPNSASRSESKISGAEHNPGQGYIQPHNPHNSAQQYPQPSASFGLYSDSRNRPSENIQGISWLKRRPA